MQSCFVHFLGVAWVSDTSEPVVMVTGHTDTAVLLLELCDNCSSSGVMGEPVLMGASFQDSSA